MAGAAVDTAVSLLKSVLQFFLQHVEAFAVVRCIAQDDIAAPIECHSIVRIRKVLGCKPEIERMFRHQLQAPSWSDRGSTSTQSDCVQLADERYVPHGIFE